MIKQIHCHGSSYNNEPSFRVSFARKCLHRIWNCLGLIHGIDRRAPNVYIGVHGIGRGVSNVSIGVPFYPHLRPVNRNERQRIFLRYRCQLKYKINWTKIITQLVNGSISVLICDVGQSRWEILLDYSQRIFVAQWVTSLQHGSQSSSLIGQNVFFWSRALPRRLKHKTFQHHILQRYAKKMKNVALKSSALISQNLTSNFSSLRFERLLPERPYNAMQNWYREFPTRSHSTWPAQLQKLAWGLKFWLQKLETFYYLGCENKGADQTARMRRLICAFVVRVWHKRRFLMARLIYFYVNRHSNDSKSIFIVIA